MVHPHSRGVVLYAYSFWLYAVYMVSSAVKSIALLALSSSLLTSAGIGTAVLASHYDSSLSATTSFVENSTSIAPPYPSARVSEYTSYRVMADYMESKRPPIPSYPESVSSGWVLPVSWGANINGEIRPLFKGYLTTAHVFADYYNSSYVAGYEPDGSPIYGLSNRDNIPLEEYLDNLEFVNFVKHPRTGVGFQLRILYKPNGRWTVEDTYVFDSDDIDELLYNYHTDPDFDYSYTLPKSGNTADDSS